jgi:hypothetical protein
VDGASGAEFLKFPKRLHGPRPGRDLHIVAGNLSAHRSADVRAWPAPERRAHMHHTPTYASWLNQVEIWFSIFTCGGAQSGKKALADLWRPRVRTFDGLMAAMKTTLDGITASDISGWFGHCGYCQIY